MSMSSCDADGSYERRQSQKHRSLLCSELVNNNSYEKYRSDDWDAMHCENKKRQVFLSSVLRPKSLFAKQKSLFTYLHKAVQYLLCLFQRVFLEEAR